MTITADELPDDLNALKAMVLSREAENARLRQIIKELQRHRFGRRAETLPEDQLLLGLEEAEQVEADGLEEKEQAATALRQSQVAKRRTNRGSLPAHLPRIGPVSPGTTFGPGGPSGPTGPGMGMGSPSPTPIHPRHHSPMWQLPLEFRSFNRSFPFKRRKAFWRLAMSEVSWPAFRSASMIERLMPRFRPARRSRATSGRPIRWRSACA